jgi:hypothetical protein
VLPATLAPARLEEFERRYPKSFRESFKRLERRVSLTALEHGDVTDRYAGGPGDLYLRELPLKA